MACRRRSTGRLAVTGRSGERPRTLSDYLVAALQTIAATIGEGVLSALQSPQPPPPEAILTALLNDLTTIQDQFVLVLDDYHMIAAKAVDQALTFLLEHLPPQMHLVIATREDPPLPLARLRAQGQLTELRATDLPLPPSHPPPPLTPATPLHPSPPHLAPLSTPPHGRIARPHPPA